jgi:hypothetical protein
VTFIFADSAEDPEVEDEVECFFTAVLVPIEALLLALTVVVTTRVLVTAGAGHSGSVSALASSSTPLLLSLYAFFSEPDLPEDDSTMPGAIADWYCQSSAGEPSPNEVDLA